MSPDHTSSAKMDGGIGVPFRFFAFGLPVISDDYFSIVKLLSDWFIWRLGSAHFFTVCVHGFAFEDRDDQHDYGFHGSMM